MPLARVIPSIFIVPLPAHFMKARVLILLTDAGIPAVEHQRGVPSLSVGAAELSGPGVQGRRHLSEEEQAQRDRTEKSPPIEGLYYRHTFSYEELNAMIEGVLFSRTLSTQEANRLVRKIEERLAAKFYKKVRKTSAPSRSPFR